MAGNALLKIDAGRRAGLVREWARLFDRVERALRRCRHSPTERRVHGLRLAVRRSLPVVEILRALQAEDPRWEISYRSLRDIVRITGPLRDMQVRSVQLGRLSRRHKALDDLQGSLESAVKKMKPLVLKALPERKGLFPHRALYGRHARELVEDEGGFARSVAGILEHRRLKLEQRWTGIALDDPATLHAARVAMKRYRYLLMALGPCLGADLRRRLEGTRILQKVIGQWHDEHLFREWLGTTGEEGGKALARMRGMKRIDRIMRSRPYA